MLMEPASGFCHFMYTAKVIDHPIHYNRLGHVILGTAANSHL